MKTLPEKWCLRITEENKAFLQNLEKEELHFWKGYNYTIGAFYSSIGFNNDYQFGSTYLPDNFTEITEYYLNKDK